MQEDYMTWKCKSIRGKIRNKKNIENKKNIDAGVKFDARWDDKLKFFFKVPNLFLGKIRNLGIITCVTTEKSSGSGYCHSERGMEHLAL